MDKQSVNSTAAMRYLLAPGNRHYISTNMNIMVKTSIFMSYTEISYSAQTGKEYVSKAVVLNYKNTRHEICTCFMFVVFP